jgi:tRNA C32,U32 (ribose-2'-O)-methylase TrmJ
LNLSHAVAICLYELYLALAGTWPLLGWLVFLQLRADTSALGEESLRQVAVHALEGFSTEEIAAKLGCTRRTVERKLERIRDKWTRLGLAPAGA